jgi:signal transduction histidine kinase
MSFYVISALINTFASLVLGVFVLIKNHKSKINATFSLFAFSVAYWSIGYYFWQVAQDKYSALLWCRILMAGAIFIPIFYFHFVLALVDLLERKKIILRIGYFIFFIFLILDFTPLFVNRVEPLLGFNFWPIAGPAYSVFLAAWFSYVIYSSYLLYQKYKNSNGIIRTQIKYVFLGMAIGFAGGSTNYFLWYKIPIPPVGNILVTVYVGTIAYAILRYRLMDIRIIARKIFIYFGASVFVYLAYSVLVWAYTGIFGSVYEANAFFVGIFIAPIFVASFYAFNSLFTRFANKYLFSGLYNYQETINRLSRELNNSNDLKIIINSIVETIQNTMKLDRAGVLLINQQTKPVHYEIAKVIGFNEQNGISLVQDNFLTKHLQTTKKPLVREELDFLARDARNAKEKNNFIQLRDNMEHIEASLCLPLLSNRILIGIIVLGSKISGDAYTKEDLDLLNTLAYQAGIAVNNARLYKEVKDFSKTLSQKVDEQTKDLRAQAEHLKKLLQMRSEFLDIASHQLKTPVSVILGTASMFREGSMDKLPPEQKKKFMDNIFYKAKKLGTIINDILRASEMDTDEFKLVAESIGPVQIEKIIKSVIDDSVSEAENKKIKLDFIKPKKITPKIMADHDFLEQAIFNLVDNAIKYTSEGFVKVILEESAGNLIIKISDSGVGIPLEDQRRMFDKFGRAKNAVNMYADGSGLGLFIVKKIILAHGGNIDFTSIEGRGTTFTISLPLDNNLSKV